MASISRALARIKDDLQTYVSDQQVLDACRDAGHVWRERKQGPVATLHLFVLQLRRGMGSDAPDFIPMLDQAMARGKIKRVLADAGYDSSSNHRHARRHKVQALIKTGIGRPTDKPPR